MRLTFLLVVVLSGCGDLIGADPGGGLPTGPDRRVYCTELANKGPNGFTDDAYNRCLYGHARGADDAGAAD